MALFLEMSSILATWLALGLLFLGLGLLLQSAWGRRELAPADLPWIFWMGWTSQIGLLQVWNLWFPVRGGALLGLAFVSLLGWWTHRREMGRLWRQPSLRLGLWGLGLGSVFLANRACGPVWNWDTYFYHLPSVHWLKEFPLLPGIGNVDSLLSYNSSQFLYVAAIDAGPWSSQARHIANGILLLPGWALLLAGLGSLLRAPVERLRWPEIFTVLLAPALIIQAVGGDLSSVSPDLPLAAVEMLLLILFLDLSAGEARSSEAAAELVFRVLLLAAAGCTLKLNCALLVVPLAGLSVLTWVWKYPGPRRALAESGFRMAWPALLVVGVWLVRGILTSGYLAYPSPWLSLPVEWKLPDAQIQADWGWIQSWSRYPWHDSSELERVGWGWVGPWSKVLVKFYAFELLVPAWLGLGGLLLALLCSRGISPAVRALQRPVFMGMALCLGFLGVWFFQAPDPRFAKTVVWGFAAAAFGLALDRTSRIGPTLTPGRVAALACLVSALLCALAMGPYRRGPVLVYPAGASGFWKERKAVYHSETNRHGLTFNVADRSKQASCWEVPLPCTPALNPELRLRRPGDWSSGFMLEPEAGSGR